jgi:mannobiose 2-epimerase
MADEAFRILQESFWDPVNGGIYWSVNPDGTPVDTKKQFYAEAFFIYALSEYYLAFKDETAKQIAESMFMLMEKFAFDSEFDGYFEAKTADWEETDDQRLSPKELNVKKSMNTHLHILEAYTNLYRIWKTEESEKQLRHLIRIFLDKIIDAETYHFHLFFDADWTVRSDIDSYGHDIEGSWLLCEAAEVLGDKELIEEVEKVAIEMAEVTKNEGLDENGGLYYEKDGDHLQEQFDWWPQAEAVVGFFNAWQLTGDEKYLGLTRQSWGFIQKYIIDPENGEWFWGVDAELKTLPNDKVNGWKAPYHNSRMCMEMMRRIAQD